MFLNGQYWGIYGLRQKPDENFVETMYGLDEEDIDMIDRLNTVIVGNTVKWNAFYTFFQTNNLATPANYAYMKSQMDVDEFINYQILEIYSANTDWTHRNYRFWSARVPGYPWRWVLQDMDAAFGARSGNVFNHKTLQYATSKSGLGATQTLLTRKLLENPEFKAEFVQRFAVYLNTTFAPANVIFLLDGMANEIAPEVPAHVARWRIPASMTAWNASLAKVRTFATRRPDLMRGQINSLLTKQGLGTLTVTSVGGGEVWVAGAPVPANYSGPHFLGFDMTLEAVEPPGVDFVEWENGSTSRTRTIPFNGNTVVTAYFGEEPPPPPPPNLVINEIHYLPSPATDELDREYVEIISAETETVDLSGFTIPAISFTFPAGASIDPGEYIVVAANSGDPFFSDVAAGSLFDFNWVSGSDPNRLGNGGEVLAVLDTLGQVADTVTYDDGGLWTSAPDGNGPSLALLEPGLDNSLAASWAASREAGGTPGAENFPPLPPTPPLVINEIHYNPSDAHGADADYEFIEILNTGVDAVVLDGFTLVGVEYTFAAGTTIGAGEFIVLAANATNYVGSYTVYQWASGELADDGERIAILDSYNQVSDEVTYDEVGPWPTTPNGTGPSLALLGPMLDNSDAASWQASTADNGTPGGVNFLP